MFKILPHIKKLSKSAQRLYISLTKLHQSGHTGDEKVAFTLVHFTQ